VSLAVDEVSTCAVTREGTVLCWGRDDDGSLGLTADASYSPCALSGGSPSQKPSRCVLTPLPVADIESAREIGKYGPGACVRTDDGAVTCWDYSTRGQKVRQNVANIARLDSAGFFGVDARGDVFYWSTRNANAEVKKLEVNVYANGL
jgi:hypothetical protein